MLERIKTGLCHPKYVGLFFKDKFHRVILLVLFFFLLFAGTIVTKCMLTDQFGTEQAFAVQKIVQYSTDSSVEIIDNSYYVYHDETDDRTVWAGREVISKGVNIL